MLELVETHKDRFSHITAQLNAYKLEAFHQFDFCYKEEKKYWHILTIKKLAHTYNDYFSAEIHHDGVLVNLYQNTCISSFQYFTNLIQKSLCLKKI